MWHRWHRADKSAMLLSRGVWHKIQEGTVRYVACWIAVTLELVMWMKEVYIKVYLIYFGILLLMLLWPLQNNVSPFVSLHLPVNLAKVFLLLVLHGSVFISILITWPLSMLFHISIFHIYLYLHTHKHPHTQTNTWITAVWWSSLAETL